MSERVVAPNLFRNIQMVTSSHNHTDHLDAETLKPVLANNPGCNFVIPEPIANLCPIGSAVPWPFQ